MLFLINVKIVIIGKKTKQKSINRTAETNHFFFCLKKKKKRQQQLKASLLGKHRHLSGMKAV